MASEQAELVFCPLGGVGEIGMNFALYGFGPPDRRRWIVVDCGVTFPGADLPGVEGVGFAHATSTRPVCAEGSGMGSPR